VSRPALSRRRHPRRAQLYVSSLAYPSIEFAGLEKSRRIRAGSRNTRFGPASLINQAGATLAVVAKEGNGPSPSEAVIAYRRRRAQAAEATSTPRWGELPRADLLSEEARDHWDSFRRLLLVDREQAVNNLDALADVLEDLPAEDRRGWVRSVCEDVLSDRRELRQIGPIDRILPHTLIGRVVMPELLEERRRAEPDAARWLGQLEARVEGAGPNGADMDPVDFAREAVECDPSDGAARRLLFLALLGGAEFATHEVPLGVIGDADGLVAVVDELEELLESIEGDDGLSARVRWLRGVAMAWSDYVAARPSGPSFEECLLAAGVDLNFPA
jgi:hypothetical protein